MLSANWMSLDPNVGPIPEAGSSPCLEAAAVPPLQRNPDQNLPLSAAEELAVELEAEQDRARLIERLKASDNLYEQAECLQGLVRPEEGSIRLETLLDQLWEQASYGRHWSVLRRITGLRGWLDEGLEDAVTDLLTRQKQVLVGKAYTPASLITEPIAGDGIAERIARFSREDVRERVLNTRWTRTK